MMLINLLPHREEKRRQRKQTFFALLLLSCGAGLAMLALAYGVQAERISAQQSRNGFLQAAIHKLDDEIKDVSSLKSEIESLKARQQAVEDLQTDRNMPVYLLNELAAQTPEGVYLTSIRQDARVVTINGVALSNERVSEFLRNAGSHSTWFDHPELVVIKASAQTTKDPHNGKRLYEFTMRVTLRAPQDVEAAASAASPASAASGVGGAASAPRAAKSS